MPQAGILLCPVLLIIIVLNKALLAFSLHDNLDDHLDHIQLNVMFELSSPL